MAAEPRDDKRDERARTDANGAAPEPRDESRAAAGAGGPGDDPWAAARAAQRDDVRAVFAPRERVCANCGAAQRGPGGRCEPCGADLTARFERWRSKRKWVLAGVAVLALAAISVPIVGSLRNDAADERERAAARQAALEAAERERLRIDARPVRAEGAPLREGDDPLAHRAALVTRAEGLIAEDARGRVAAGS